jgi:hypothetical protein
MTMAEIEAIETPDATAEPQAYREALLAVIGDRDPLEVMAETLGRVRALAQGRSAGDLERRSGDGEWSAAEVVGHLVDVEIVVGFRLRLVLTDDRPSYPGYDEKLWSRLPKPPADQLVGVLDGLRAYNLWMLRSIPRAEWSRAGVHSEQGEETVEVMIRKLAGHDLTHMNQLERALAR